MVAGSTIYKMSGSGNDFVMLDGRSESVMDWPAERIRAVCARRTGVGADGVVFVKPGSRRDAVRFTYFNADGSPASMCGNAALCATRLAASLGLASADGLVLETDAGNVAARCLNGPGERAEIELPQPDQVTEPAIRLAAGERGVRFTVVGVPHLVLLVDDVRAVPLLERGRALRRDPSVMPAGANVNFVSGTPDGGWTMRTYERGVEDETLACGTGAVSVAAALLDLGEIQNLPLNVRTASGLALSVAANLAEDGRLGQPRLGGEGRQIFRAVINI